MNVSIQDMQNTAADLGPPINISNDIGNVIEISDLNDDLGLNMLANQSRIKPESSQPSFGSSPIRLSVPDSDYKQVNFGGLEPIELNTGGNGFMSEIPAAQPFADVSVMKESSPYNNYQSSS